VFQNLKGVIEVESGYAGGEISNPTYSQVSNGNTNYAEVIKIKYDENIISTEKILTVFFATHDPTTINQQGVDMGTQYRSAIFYFDEEQKMIAEKMINEIENSTQDEVMEKINKKDFENIHVTTEVSLIKNYYKAEDYHQNYYNENKEINGYCKIVINPKLEKVQKKFAELLK
jgi:methionine-S-sulfoxide reductase